VSAAKVEALVASGNRSLANKDYDIASEFFEEALSLDPNNQEAKSGLQKASKAK
jgi:Flp pilus assembly protein TadD